METLSQMDITTQIKAEKHDESSNRIRKVRNRVPTSCNVCRKKKIKCDKVRPFCSSCVKASSSNLCFYEQQPWDVATDIHKLNVQILQLKQQNADLKEVIANYERIMSNSTNSSGKHSGHSPSLVPSHSLSNNSSFYNKNDIYDSNHIIEQDFEKDEDVIDDLVKNFDVLVIKEDKLLHFGCTSFMALMTNESITSSFINNFIKSHKKEYFKANNPSGKLDASEYAKESELDIIASGAVQEAISTPACEINGFGKGLSSDSKQGTLVTSKILESVNAILPPKRFFRALISRFFDKCYILMPYVDRSKFIENLNSILRSDSQREIYFTVSKNQQMLTVALALIFVRFAYMTLNFDNLDQDDNSSANNDLLSREIYAANVKISATFVDKAQACISSTSPLSKITIETLQAWLYLKLYKLNCAEDGDDGPDAAITLSVMIQMAKLIGLNRDPENFSIVSDARLKHVWRKIWYKLLDLDAQNALHFGTGLLVKSEDEYDTELPYISFELRNKYLHPQEEQVINWFHTQSKAMNIKRAIANSLFSVRRDPKKSDVIKKVSEFKTFLDTNVPSFDQLSDNSTLYGNQDNFCEETPLKLMNCILRLQLSTIYHVLNYIIMITTPETDREARNKHRKETLSSALRIFKFALEYFNHPNAIFGEDLRRLATPYVLYATLRVFQMIAISIIRNFDDLNESFQYLDPEMTQWLTVNKTEISKITGINESETSKIMALQLYNYVEDIYRHCEGLCRFFTAWKFNQVILMFMVYLIEKYPVFKTLSNKQYAMRKKIEAIATAKKPRNLKRTALASASEDEYINEVDRFQRELSKKLVNNFDFLGDSANDDQWLDIMNEFDHNKTDFFESMIGDSLINPSVFNSYGVEPVEQDKPPEKQNRPPVRRATNFDGYENDGPVYNATHENFYSTLSQMEKSNSNGNNYQSQYEAQPNSPDMLVDTNEMINEILNGGDIASVKNFGEIGPAANLVESMPSFSSGQSSDPSPYTPGTSSSNKNSAEGP